MMLDTSRHYQVFDISKLVDIQTCIIGVGAIGSRLALHWAELSFGPHLICDDDRIVGANIANQVYATDDIGVAKVSALTYHLAKKGWKKTCAFDMKVEGELLAYNVIACCVDSMDTRKMIFEKSVPKLTKVSLYIDTRMNASSVMIYLFDPRDEAQRIRYAETLYSNDEVNIQHGGCTLTQSIGCTAQIAASLATARIMDWLMGRQKVFETLLDWRTNVFSNQML